MENNTTKINENAILRMEKKVKAVRTLLIALSVLCVVSIPLIVVGATLAVTPLTVCGGILCGIGFLGAFYGWTFWGLFYGRLNLLKLIVRERLTGIDEISESAGKSKGQIRRDVKLLIKGGHLSGFKFSKKEDGILSTNERDYSCPACGAPLKAEEKVCPYCNVTVR